MGVRTRFLVMSDTHAAGLAGADSPRAFRTPLPAADVLIHAGDLTMTGEPGEHEAAIALLAACDAPVKLVVPGNHDLTLDPAYADRQRAPDEQLRRHRAALAQWTGPAARAANITLLGEGLHRIELPSGALLRVYASPLTPAFFDWAFMYDPATVDPWGASAPHPLPEHPGADIVVTHGPPRGHLGMTTRGEDAGCAHLTRALRRCKPLMHCFGHIHEGWGAEVLDWTGADDARRLPFDARAREVAYVDATPAGSTPVWHGRETLLVNAAIMDVQYMPRQAPWLVDLELPDAAAAAKERPK